MFYRAKKGALSDTRMAVVVQEMVRADKSGVLFTIDPIRKRRDRMVIEAVFGLGEGIVSGEITPDHYVLERETGAVVEEFISVQQVAVTYDAQLDGTRHGRSNRSSTPPPVRWGSTGSRSVAATLRSAERPSSPVTHRPMATGKGY